MLIDRFPQQELNVSLPSLTQELLQPFSPYQALAQTLLPLTLESDDGSHDVAHLHRVWKNCRRISKLEGGDRRILCAAVLLHDAVAVEKNSPQRHQASRMAAEQATLTLTRLEWAPADIAAVAHAIEAHSFPPASPRKRWKRRSCRMPIASTPSASSAWRAASISAAACAARCMMPPTRGPNIVNMTTSVSAWTTSKPSCSNCKTASRPPPGDTWPSCAPNACGALSTICWKRCNVGLAGIFVMPITFSVT
nr:HD domain-containing protein [Serratia marcescens]